MEDGVWELPNGDEVWIVTAFKCDHCKKRMWAGDWRLDVKNCNLCLECSFLHGFMGAEEYLDNSCGSGGRLNMHAAVRDGKIVKWKGNKKPWERPDTDYRKNTEYRTWRLSVFGRDRFKCQHCGQAKGEVEAHHIKSFKQYVKLRYDVDNGVTLCKPCHLLQHNKRSKK